MQEGRAMAVMNCFLNLSCIALGSHRAVAEAMKKVYEDRGLFDLWLVIRQAMISKCISPSLLI